MWKILWRLGSSIVPEVSRRSVEKMLLLLLLLLCSILLQLLLLFTKDTLPSSSCTSLGHSCAQSNYWEGLCTRPAFGGTWRFGIFTTLFGGQGETERGHIFHSLFLALHFTFSPLGPVRNHVSTILLLGHPQPHNSTGVSATTQSEYVETGCTLNFCFFSMR